MADLLALEDRDRRRGIDQPVLTQIGTEGGGPRPGRGRSRPVPASRATALGAALQ
jgi:hypothetical protein